MRAISPRMSEAAVDFMNREYSRKLMADKMIAVLSDAVYKTKQTNERIKING